jgi:hypothetical protein
MLPIVQASIWTFSDVHHAVIGHFPLRFCGIQIESLHNSFTNLATASFQVTLDASNNSNIL